jgi:hypothetical protein
MSIERVGGVVDVTRNAVQDSFSISPVVASLWKPATPLKPVAAPVTTVAPGLTTAENWLEP